MSHDVLKLIFCFYKYPLPLIYLAEARGNYITDNVCSTSGHQSVPCRFLVDLNSEEMPVKREPVPPGTTIHREQPFVYVLSSKFRTECCDFCLRKCSQLSKCSGCKYVYYCGRACQKQGWTVHKPECKNLRQISPRVLPDAARMLYRLIMKLQNGGVSYKAYYTERNYRMWRDLMSHYAELKTDKKRMEHMMSLYGVLMEFSQGESLPNNVEFMGLYGRMCVNSFNICNQELQSLGTGIYLGASIIDHSCQPNALATFEGTTLIVRTLERLPELDWSKIRISYIDVLASTEERQKELMETYYFVCDCPKCSMPEAKADMFGAACPNEKCDNSVEVLEGKGKCNKCERVLPKTLIRELKNVVEFTEMHLANMRTITYLDVCRVCLKKQKGVLNKFHLKHVKVLDLAFESCIDLEDFDQALEYGLELIDAYYKYYPDIHPLTGLLQLKLCKLLLYKDQVKEGVANLKRGAAILKVTHGASSSLYQTEVLPLIRQCRSATGRIERGGGAGRTGGEA